MELGTIIPQMIIGLLVVLGLMSLMAFVARRMSLRGPAGQSRLQILTTLPIGSKEKLLLVRCGEQDILLGVTAQSIQALSSAPVTEDSRNIEEPVILKSVVGGGQE
ncbi:MAG: flagellar biosynthetic protein FliO [Xanthomonadales bacterium]|nr:flagellar biosynthetic protein FliO [Xanthomonadales bacterium]